MRIRDHLFISQYIITMSLSYSSGSESYEEEPILRTPFAWVGSKKRFIDMNMKYIPEKWNDEKNTYYEPFIGSGAMFLAIKP